MSCAGPLWEHPCIGTTSHLYELPSFYAPATCVLYADLQLYIDGHSRGTSTDHQQVVIVRWANVLQWFSVRASWVHSIEIRNFSDDFAAQHDCPPGMAAVHALQALYFIDAYAFQVTVLKCVGCSTCIQRC